MKTSKLPKKKTPKEWHPQHEKILKAWGESCACYRYLHYKAHQKYRRSTMRFTLPIIIISTITGTANFAQETFPETWRGYVPAGIGTLNLFAAILTTISQFLKVNELQESHRVSSVHYGKLSRIIRLELSLPITERGHDGSNMVEICRSEFDRLIEQSPPVSGDILRQFERRFATHNVTMPEISTVKPIEMFDATRELTITKKSAKKFLDAIRIKKITGEGVLHRLESLKKNNIVSGRKMDDFYDCELATGDSEVDSIHLEENNDKNNENE